MFCFRTQPFLSILCLPLLLSPSQLELVGNLFAQLWLTSVLLFLSPHHMFSYQVVKMMMGVVSLFLVCWLPYHAYFILANLYPAINYSHYIQVGTNSFTKFCALVTVNLLQLPNDSITNDIIGDTSVCNDHFSCFTNHKLLQFSSSLQ